MAALVRCGWDAGLAGPGVAIHRVFLIVLAVMLVALPWATSRERVFGRVADSWAARLLRLGTFGALCALPLVLLDLGRFAGARFDRDSFGSAADRAQWHAERVHDAVAGSVAVFIVMAIYTTGCLWLTSGRSRANQRTLLAGGGCGVLMGLAVYGLAPFGSILHVASWLAPLAYLAVSLAFFGAPLLAGKLAGNGVTTCR